MVNGKVSNGFTHFVIDAREELLPLPSSTPDLLNALSKIEKLVFHASASRLSESIIKETRPIAEALISKEVVKHVDIEVNIQVVYCICEILSLMDPDIPYSDQQFKEFFELVVMTFEKVSFSSGGCYEKLFESIAKLGSDFYRDWISKLQSRLSRSSINLPEFELLNARKKVSQLPSSKMELLAILAKIEKVLAGVEQTPSKSMKYAINAFHRQLFSDDVLRHPDIDVNISVACCICEIMRIGIEDRYETYFDNKKLKEFFELAVTTFEKLSSASGGCFFKMIKVLETLTDARLLVAILDESRQLEELVIRLFKQFLAVADSNSSATVNKMEKIMTMIIGDTEEERIPELEDLLVRSVKKDNQISSPVCWKLGKKVIKSRNEILDGKVFAGFKQYLIDRQKDLLPLPSLTPELLNTLSKIEKMLYFAGHSWLKSVEDEICSIAEVLIGKEVARHPDIKVNILVICCICEILRQMRPRTPYNEEQFKEFIKLVVTAFEKLYFAPGRCYEDIFVRIVPTSNYVSGRTEVYYPDWVSELESRLSLSSIHLPEFEILNAWKKLSHLSSELLDILAQIENILASVKQPPSKTIKYAVFALHHALFGEIFLRHPDMKVNISVACCICEIVRIEIEDPFKTSYIDNKKLKEFFELSLTTFEKLSSASGGCFSDVIKILETLRDARLLIRILGLEELIIRLFKQFLTVADYNSSAIVYQMKKIMIMIIEECGEELLPKLVDVLFTNVRNDNQITPPFCYQLAEKVIKKCAAQIKPHLPDMEGKETYFNTTKKRKLMMDTEVNESTRKKQVVVSLSPNVSSSQSGLVCVHGYMVKNDNAPILEAIFKKHGDIASGCVFGRESSMRVNLLEVVCEAVIRIEEGGFIVINSAMAEIESQLLVAEAAKINVLWLRAYLEAFHKYNETKEHSYLLMETKRSTISVKEAAKMDLDERRAEFMIAQQRLEKAEKCVKVLDLVENKLYDNILDSEAEMESWLKQPVI